MLSHGDLCELTRICGSWDDSGEGGPPCVLTFRDIESGAKEEKSYSSMFGKKAGSGRLQRPPPTLAPPPRATRSDATSDETRTKIRMHALDVCATSRYLIVHAKIAAKECDQHTPPGMVIDNSDWSENGEIVRKLQMQYEYWDIRYLIGG